MLGRKTCKICKPKHHASPCFSPIEQMVRTPLLNKKVSDRTDGSPDSARTTTTNDCFSGTIICSNMHSSSRRASKPYVTLLVCAYINLSNPSNVERRMSVLAFLVLVVATPTNLLSLRTHFDSLILMLQNYTLYTFPNTLNTFKIILPKLECFLSDKYDCQSKISSINANHISQIEKQSELELRPSVAKPPTPIARIVHSDSLHTAESPKRFAVIRAKSFVLQSGYHH
uniref:Uncharacterized protein n=1 Tax=Heterorhabditis bacteriophora TaxID=37862 RepID=A0A1I7WQN9_HETBA